MHLRQFREDVILEKQITLGLIELSESCGSIGPFAPFIVESSNSLLLLTPAGNLASIKQSDSHSLAGMGV